MKRTFVALLAIWILLTVPSAPARAQLTPQIVEDWVTIDYATLVDRRALSHSGESVGMLLDRLDGRPLPPPGQRPDDRNAHGLLDPLVEPYAFVLPDALDTLLPFREKALPLVELGPLWRPGARQPAWVELLRARRFLLESDGRGRLRACLPWSPEEGTASAAASGLASDAAAEKAWARAWPVLRHVLAAERRRLAGADGQMPELRIEVHAYHHMPEVSRFLLGTEPHRVKVEETGPDGLRPPLDVGRLERFLGGGLRLEGARIGADGELRLLGSESETPPGILGRPLQLADLAVAYRAIFHGGLAEPYMSLDRGYSPHTSLVTYGGRLRDTALGLVSLLCDIRFKTFSMGLDVVSGEDLRPALRAGAGEFRTHLERLAAHPDSAGMAGQQTRLWFYPDNVDLTISAQGDVIVMRRVRMSAASERVEGREMKATGDDPPWTRETIEAINRDYDALAGFFPEMGDLDQLVRLLALFTWLERAESDGHLVPELDGLLAVELPQLYTPRSFPQLLAFNALPDSGSSSAVEVFDRVGIGDALDRLAPASGRPLPALRRFQSAMSALDPTQKDHAAMLAELRGLDPAKLDDSALDFLVYRAERLTMHRRVLATLPAAQSRTVSERQDRGENLRVFSVGIGGLDLGMDRVLARASGGSLGLGRAGPGGGVGRGAAADAARRAREATPREPRESWRHDPEELRRAVMPAHGYDGTEAGSGEHRVTAGGGSRGPWVLVVNGADGSEVSTRRVDREPEATGGVTFDRLESSRRLRYRVEKQGAVWATVPLAVVAREPVADGDGSRPLPDGLGLLGIVDAGAPASPTEPPAIAVRLETMIAGARRGMEADFPRSVMRRVTLGKQADLTPGRALSGFAPLPDAFAAVDTMMVGTDEARRLPPWIAHAVPVPGEEDPQRFARALDEWWGDERAAIVGIDAGAPERWASAPRPTASSALLLLPEGAFPGRLQDLRRDLESAWPGARTDGDLPDGTTLVILVSAEPPDLCAARLRQIARAPAMQGGLLAGWCTAGPVRQDLAPSLLAEGPAAVGLAEATLVARRGGAERIAQIWRALEQGPAVRVERLPGPFLWYF